MPELPEVETVRRMLGEHLPGRRVQRARASRLRLRGQSLHSLPSALLRRRFGMPDRIGKLLLLPLGNAHTLLSHLGMSGRWLWWPRGTAAPGMPHVHLELVLDDGSRVRYQDPRRFGMLRVVANEALHLDPALRTLGPDPLRQPPTGPGLHQMTRGVRTSIKSFLLDQRRMAGLGNIYVSEILFLARLDPRRRSGSLDPAECARIADHIVPVLDAAISRMGTTISTFRNIWNESGQYGEQLRVYDRAGEPCVRCGARIARIVQSGRSTFLCPECPRKSLTRTPRKPISHK